MSLTFAQAEALFRQDKLDQLIADPDGQRFLKLRSISRPDHLKRLFKLANMEQPNISSHQLFAAAFSADIPVATIERCAREIYREEREQRRANEAELLNQLYRVQEFNWGGLYQNSLERTIVDNYVKKITDYDTLCRRIDNELFISMRGYVICSWYNHWTSVIIEDIFKEHSKVLPAVGLVKKIDFFIYDTPFDLKVTYLPETYISLKRKTARLQPELTLLKQVAKENNIPIAANLAGIDLLQDLWAKVPYHPSSKCEELIAELRSFRSALVNEIEQDPTDVIRWLYENQGERRFDASNRLFLLLVDQQNYFDSWKLKRAKFLIEAKVKAYLDGCKNNPGRQIEFNWRNKSYLTISDMIIIRHQ